MFHEVFPPQDEDSDRGGGSATNGPAAAAADGLRRCSCDWNVRSAVTSAAPTQPPSSVSIAPPLHVLKNGVGDGSKVRRLAKHGGQKSPTHGRTIVMAEKIFPKHSSERPKNALLRDVFFDTDRPTFGQGYLLQPRHTLEIAIGRHYRCTQGYGPLHCLTMPQAYSSCDGFLLPCAASLVDAHLMRNLHTSSYVLLFPTVVYGLCQAVFKPVSQLW